jgi:DNA-binding CsgD family transcriptional regulator
MSNTKQDSIVVAYQIYELLESGFYIKEIAEKLECSVSYVTEVSKKLKFNTSKSIVWTKQDHDVLKKLYSEGKSYKEIAKELHFPNYTVKAYLHRYFRISKQFSRNYWSFKERDLLLKLYTSGATLEEIKKHFPIKDPFCILVKLQKLIVDKSYSNTFNKWTKEETEELDALRKKMSLQELVNHFNRAPNKIKDKIRALMTLEEEKENRKELKTIDKLKKLKELNQWASIKNGE